nr:hypothetical protein [Tanacetum cinerariifolium]
MAPLTFADTHNMVAFLSKSDTRDGFDQIVVEKVNGNVQLQALIDDKKVVVTEAIIRRDLHLDDADGVERLPNAEIFEELARLGYEKPPPMLTFYKAFFFTQWNSIAFVVICLATGRKLNFSKYIFDSMVRNVDGQSVETPLFDSMLVQSQQQAKVGVEVLITHAQPSTPSSPSPTELRDTIPSPHDTPPQYQPPTPHDSPLQDQPTTPYDSPMPLLTTLMETSKEERKKARKEKEVKEFRVKRLRRVGADQRVESSSDTGSCLDAESQGRTELKTKVHLVKENINVASKGVSVVIAPKLVSTVEPTVFDDEDVIMKMAQTLIKLKSESIKRYQDLKKKPVSVAQARKNMMIYLKNMAGYKMEFFKGMTYDEIRPIFKRDYNKIQTLFKQDKDVKKKKKKRVADETLLQESFKKLRAAEVSGSESTQEIPTDDPKEITEENVQTMLDIVPLPKFKVKASQVKNKREKDKIETKLVQIKKKGEAWRSPEKSRAVSVDRARKTKENAKRMVKNANTVTS